MKALLALLFVITVACQAFVVACELIALAFLLPLRLLSALVTRKERK